MKARNAIMVHTQRKRVTTNAGYTMTFEPGVEKFVPGIAVAQAQKYGATVVRYVEGSMEVPRSTDPVKVAELVSSSVVDAAVSEAEEMAEAAQDEAALEHVEATSEEDAAIEVAAAVENLGSFTQKEARIKNAILKLLSENDPDKFVGVTGRPKISALTTVLGGESLTAEVRDIVWEKMEAEGLFDEVGY